ncbi:MULTISPECIES: 5'-nucleotidase C-terminal domain-containing protein [unclassified Rhizobium]|uniref:5'-nucleotidase C-terminal domain-containing protein n=1 Tax=unclassified Rhizobium TaxID=2613769 RepID=UPI000EA86B85|nr:MULTISPECIES: 5'-nucleotidase C-terminal domain-containing protein [unclassified Rhizobium]AYG67288.1 LysM peptidoglycan-binding domain-containing protein [Rhizobium sp. CCGE531]AYG73682.1 LysM peptidoglycan-binding domain-containing protein [Rhizobium sp. CCGE532]
MKQAFGVGLLAATLLALSTSAAFADYQLNILHFNDFHSRVESINKFDATCSAAEEAKNECFGGAARLKTIIDQRRAALAGQNVLVLDAGDNFQGSLFYTTYKGAAEVEFLNDVKIDAMTVGNHEFDDGEGPLAAFLDKAQFPVVTANLVVDDQSKLGERIKKSIVLDIGGQKIGIVGAVTTETPELASPGPHVKITDDAAAISAEVDALKSQGVNKIIALTHVGYPRDVEKIAKIAGVSIVVGGHSHTLLSNTDPKAAGPYPTMVDNPAGYKVPVVQAASYGKYLGDLVVTFDDKGVIKDAKGDPILLDASIKPDPAIAARVQEMAKPIEELRKKVIGSSQAPIEGAREICRVQECSMGNLVADAMLDRTKAQGISIAVQNGGGLRASIGAGDVSMGDVLTVLPFQNTVATFQLTGAEVKAALENGLSQIDEGAGRFPQVAGLKYSFDKTKPAGSRLVSVEVQEGTEFKPIDPEKAYGVVSNNYMRAGGDGYAVFAKDAKNAYDFGPNLESVVADYLGAHNPYRPYTDGRISQVGAATAAAQPEPVKPADTATQQAAPEQKPVPATDGGAASSTATPPASSAPKVTIPSTTMPANPAATPSAPAKSDPATSTPATAAPATETPATATPATSAPAATTPEATAPAVSASEPPKTPTTHVIVAGDTLWDLAKTYYANAGQWHKLLAANRNIKPHHLPVGEKLRIPSK